ncbi:MAG: ABC transporter permease [Bacteroidia bacterium]|nr:ABC transporter permease [Bacteroidia bacterium]
MKNIFVIFKREYLTRVKNKTFILMTFLAPLLMVGFYAATIYIATETGEDNRTKTVYLTDYNPSLLLSNNPPANYVFLPAPSNDDSAISDVKSGRVFGWLKVEDRDTRAIDSATYYTAETPSLVEMEGLKSWIQGKANKYQFAKLGLRESQIDSAQASCDIVTKEVSNSGDVQESSSTLKSGIGFALAFMIYIFIFVYGSMVMRSAMEEKTNRIVEVIVSSVRPFHLMMGKILGVAAVGLTQFVAWIVLAVGLVMGISALFLNSGSGMSTQEAVQKGIEARTGMATVGVDGGAVVGDSGSGVARDLAAEFTEPLSNLPYFEIIAVFLLFFVGGYLLYSSFFAAIGSAVNQESDVQQFMMPVTLPLVFGFVIAQTVALKAPHGAMAKLFSMIPLTSPIVMVVRAPFGVPLSELALSFGLLVLMFVLMVWLSSRIYRIGILSYGKKPTWKDLWKWLR